MKREIKHPKFFLQLRDEDSKRVRIIIRNASKTIMNVQKIRKERR